MQKQDPVSDGTSILEVWEGILRRHVARVEFQIAESKYNSLAIEFAKLELELLQRLIAKLQ
jgi:hypothetical protein